MPNYLSNLANRMSQEMNNSVPRPHSPQQSCGGSQTNSSGKRANRTRFTDYQIKVLQEFFENNAYPKDDDLEYLSKLLGLSPRVIVVWFQNARQKARKIYENQPAGNECSPVASNTSSSSVSGAVGATVAVMSNNNADSDSEQNNAGRFTRTPGLNYQCKKCLLVFQRYYELIRHQKQHCYKEEDAKRSAQAQKAAGVAAAQYVGQYNSNNSEDSNHSNDRSVHSPLVNEEDLVRQYVGNNPFLSGAFQQQSQHQQQSQALNQQQTSNHHSGHDEEIDEDMENESDENSLCSTPSSSKRKLSDDGTELDAEELQNREKRLRTTITQEQLDFLYQKYQSESNPSRKSLEQIAGQVGLRKRVVQVWFQNTRARERKGLYIKPELNHDENFLMKCPMCPNVSPFKSRLSWESHIGTYHPDLMENDDVVVPDSIASLIPNSASAYNLQSSMRKYYEDTMKRFMNDMQENNKEQGVGVAVGGGAVGALDLTSSDMETLSDHILDEDRDPNGDSSSQYGGNKRFRTQMTGLQIKMMKAIFENYKTPSMSECHGLGKEIGLQKRVVQVWFQNARAKEKRAKLQYSQSNGGIEPPQESVPPVPDECHICSYKYGSHYSVQDHIFSKSHLDKLRTALEAGLYEPESPGQIITGGVVAAGGNANVSSGGNTPLGGGGGEPLQMLQINNRDLLDMTSRSNNRMMMQV
ncbi:zinc finger homeobox protein 3-like [Lepeophtheirus salmonis]|uniref:zinc finger homeobox protein 3-like n=1 Tax=Lepeophtheirus salmonis TaxID=72036 RepID=UPI003AF39E21